jgi:pimeloyl-ACP methyl ester carboxylesterase
MREIFIRAGSGTQLRILTSESARQHRWVLLWPGLGATAEEFLRLLREAPREGWNVAAFDPPGHGHSDWWGTWSDAAPLSVWDMVWDAVGRPERPVVGGHSAGAYFGVQWALGRPDRCGGLLLLEGGYMDPGEGGSTVEDAQRDAEHYHQTFRFPSWEVYERAQRAEAGSWDDDIAAMLRALVVADEGALRLAVSVEAVKALAGTLANYRVGNLPTLACPALLATATQPGEMAAMRHRAKDQLKARIRRLEWVEISGAGHDLMIDRPAAVAEAVWAFLRSLDPSE